MRGVDATASGCYIWPLLFGMMGSSIGIGILISRTGRYKWPITASTAVLVAGAYLMTSLSAATPDWLIWLGLFAIGLGIGPSIAGMREGHSPWERPLDRPGKGQNPTVGTLAMQLRPG